MSGTINLILITLLLVATQQPTSARLQAYAWGMMLWLGVPNAALLVSMTLPGSECRTY